jgi:lysophospholipase L1-like esterase
MKNQPAGDTFPRSAAMTIAALAALAAVPWIAQAAYAVPFLRLPAALTVIARSHASLDNAGVTGYYERLFEAGAIKFGKPKPHPFRVYSFAFPGHPAAVPKPPWTRRIVLLGSSIAAGAGVDVSRNFGSRFENRLNAGHLPRHFEVTNLAVGGYKITQVMDVALDEAPRLQPDVYLFSLTELHTFRNWSEHLADLVQMGLDLKYSFLRDTIRAAGVRGDDDRLTILGKLEPYRMDIVGQSLLQIKSRAEQDHAYFFVILMPCLEDGNWSRRRMDGMEEFVASLGIPVINLLDTFEGILDLAPLRVRPSDVHPNERGHEMISENLYRKLRARPDIWAGVTESSRY